MTRDRLPKFHCDPSKLLGAMAGLTADQNLLYLTVLFRIYEVRGPIADSAAALGRRCGLTERRAVAALEELLLIPNKLRRLGDGQITNEFAEAELDSSKARAERVHQIQSRRAKKGWQKRKEIQSNGDARAMPGHAHGMPTSKKERKKEPRLSLVEPPSGSTTSVPVERSGDAEASRRGSRLGQGVEISSKQRDDAVRLGLAPGEIDRRWAEFVDYWSAIPGQRGSKADWDATWRNRVRRIIEWKAGRGSAKPPRWTAADVRAHLEGDNDDRDGGDSLFGSESDQADPGLGTRQPH